MISAFNGLHISVILTVQGLVITKKIIDQYEIKSISIRPTP
jgi:hypothetical protein